MIQPDATYRQLIPQAEWEILYPKEGYQTEGKTFTLHFLLALNQPDSTIVQYIANIKEKDVYKLNLADPRVCGLTPLHIAAMKAKKTVVQALLGKPEVQKAINQPDVYGWTALHHALISSEEVFQMLIKAGADASVRTGAGGSLEDLRELIGRAAVNSAPRHVFFLKENVKVPLCDLADHELKNLTFLLKYSSKPLYSPECYQELWRQNIEDLESPLMRAIHQAELKIYVQHCLKPPELLVSECEELKGKVPLPLELKAVHPLKKGEIIAEYAGVIKPWKKPKWFFDLFSESFDDPFRLHTMTAKEVGSAARWMNCGFPNVILDQFTALKGTTRMIAIAADDIQAGTPLVWCYGLSCAPLIYGKQVLLRRAEMRKYFEKGLKTLVDELNRQYVRLRQNKDLGALFCFHVEQSALETRLLYPLQTPGALLDLHFSSLVDASLWNWMIDESNLAAIKVLINAQPFECWMMRCFVIRIQDFEEKIKPFPEIRKQIADFVLEAIGSLSVMQIMKLLSQVSLDAKTITDVQDYLKKKRSELEHYDWTLDEEAPLGFENRTRDILKYMLIELKRKNISKKQALASLTESCQEMAQKAQGEDFEELRQFRTVLEMLKTARL